MYYSIRILQDCKILFKDIYTNQTELLSFKEGQVLTNVRVDLINNKHYLLFDTGMGGEIFSDLFEKIS